MWPFLGLAQLVQSLISPWWVAMAKVQNSWSWFGVRVHRSIVCGVPATLNHLEIVCVPFRFRGHLQKWQERAAVTFQTSSMKGQLCGIGRWLSDPPGKPGNEILLEREALPSGDGALASMFLVLLLASQPWLFKFYCWGMQFSFIPSFDMEVRTQVTCSGGTPSAAPIP